MTVSRRHFTGMLAGAAAIGVLGRARIAAATEARVSNAEAVKGVWILAGNSGTAIDSTAELEALRGTLDPALASEGMRGFSLRVTWSAIDRDLALLEHGRRIAEARGLAFSFRVLAGYRVPARIFDDGSPFYFDAEGRDRRIPTPFRADGSPNKVFERHYAAMLRRVTDWARANGVRLVHCPWYGLSWAELNHEVGVRRAPGYTYDRWFDAHVRLFDLALQFADDQLAIELPLSGGGPTGDTVTQLADHAWARLGPRNDRFFFQANGWGPGGYWGSPNPEMERMKREAFDRPVPRGLQSIRQGDYEWRELFQLLRESQATYAEIYADTLKFARADVMRAEIARLAAEVARSPAPLPPSGPAQPPRLAMAPAETNKRFLAGRWRVQAVANDAEADRLHELAGPDGLRGVIAEMPWTKIDESWALIDRAHAAATRAGLRFALALNDGEGAPRLNRAGVDRASEYEKFIAHLAGWCRAREVRLLIVPTPGVGRVGRASLPADRTGATTPAEVASYLVHALVPSTEPTTTTGVRAAQAS